MLIREHDVLIVMSVHTKTGLYQTFNTTHSSSLRDDTNYIYVSNKGSFV